MEILFCPHCNIGIEIESINCGIFRCGIYKNGMQINPHLPKEECERIKNEIWGCGKPFQYIDGKIIKCEYI